jgi:phenylacetate-CoA ligase
VTPFLRRRLFGPLFARREGLDYARHLEPLKQELMAVADPAVREHLQVERTSAIVRHAYANSPFYRALYDAHGFRPERFRDLRDLPLVPVFEKSAIPGEQERIRAQDRRRHDLVPTATGGTTGNSFTFWYDRECFGRRHALTLVANEAYGWRYGDPVAYVWNAHQDAPARLQSVKSRLRSWLTERRLYIDASRIDDSLLAGWVRQLREMRIEILYGYAHSLGAIAEYCEREGVGLPAVRLVVSTAEPLFAADRQRLARVFACPVRDRYGSREHGLMAQEDADANLRYFANSILLETESGPGESGDILVTDFWNRAFPFVRYRIGDTCQLATAGLLAAGLPRLGRLTGRQTDFLVAADGGRVSGMSFHEAYIDPETGACGTDDFLAIQFIQTAPLRICVRYVPGPTFVHDRVTANLERLVHHLLGDPVAVEFEKVAVIARTASGKYRFTINQVA